MSSLPSYTPEVLPGYDLTPATSVVPSVQPSSTGSSLSFAQSHPNYTYRSERMELDLGPRRWGTKLPAYGRTGEIQGTVQVHSFKHVDRVVVRLLGKISTSQVVNQIRTFSQSHVIVNESVELWSAETQSTNENVFPFSFNLADEFPPSATIELRRAQASVAYAIRVNMYRKGIHMHDTLQTEILYLPRTTTTYCRPFIPESGNEKRPQISSNEWHAVQLQRELSGTKTSTPPGEAPELLLPQNLAYPSGHTIPFIVNSSTGAVELQLVRISSVHTRTGVVQQLKVISHGRVTCDHGGQIRGEIDMGEEGKENNWGVDKVAKVSYEVCVRVPSSERTAWKATQEVTLVTHEWRGEIASRLPVLGARVTSRTTVNLMNMDI